MKGFGGVVMGDEVGEMCLKNVVKLADESEDIVVENINYDEGWLEGNSKETANTHVGIFSITISPIELPSSSS